MDRAVHPGDDFWSYVNGTWARTVEIPADRGAFSQVQRLNDLSFGRVRDILDEFIGRRASLSGDERRVTDYYAALMDQAAIDARGAAPLLADLASVRAAATHSELAATDGPAGAGMAGAAAARPHAALRPLALRPRYRAGQKGSEPLRPLAASERHRPSQPRLFPQLGACLAEDPGCVPGPPRHDP